MRTAGLPFVVCLLVSSAVAHAEDAPPPASPAPTATAVATAETLLRDGVALRKQRREAEALAKFIQAFALAPTPRAAAQMGLAERVLAQWEAAERHLTRALSYDDDEWIRRNRDPLDQSLRSVQRHLGWLSIEVDEPGLVIVPAGRDPEALPLKEPLRVPAGVVKYTVRNGSGEPLVDAEAIVVPGEVTRRRHAMALPRPETPVVFGENVEKSQASTRLGAAAGVLVMPTGPAPTPPVSSLAPPDEFGRARRRVEQERIVAYGLGGLGVASLLTSVAFGVLTFDAKGKLSEGCVKQGNCGADPDYGENARAHEFASVANVLMVAGVAATGLGTYFFFKARSDERSLPPVSIRPTVNGLRVTF